MLAALKLRLCRGAAQAARNYPQIEEARAMLAAMPRTTCLQRRNRVIFAVAFLGALRADMGHGTEQITDACYGKLREDACDPLFEEMANGFRKAEARALPTEAMKEIGAKLKDLLGALERHGMSFDDLQGEDAGS